MGRPPIGDGAMTNAGRIARWRKRHANKLTRKAAHRPSQHHLPLTIRQAVFPNNNWQGSNKISGALAEGTLTKMRLTGDGPPFVKVGPRAVAYRKADLDTWLAGRVRRSTSDTFQTE